MKVMAKGTFDAYREKYDNDGYLGVGPMEDLFWHAKELIRLEQLGEELIRLEQRGEEGEEPKPRESRFWTGEDTEAGSIDMQMCADGFECVSSAPFMGGTNSWVHMHFRKRA